MARQRGFHQVRRSARRQTAWGVGPGGTAANTTISTSTALIMGSGAGPASDSITIARLRGEFTAWLSTTQAAAGGFAGAIGVGVVSLAAFNAGVASVPTPITEEDWDGWFYHRYFSLKSPGSLTGGAITDIDANTPIVASIRLEVDSKAMRKIDIQEVAYAAIEVVEVGTATMESSFNSRLLAMLP